MKVNKIPSGINCLINTANSTDGSNTSTHGIITWAKYSRIDNLISLFTMSNLAVYAIKPTAICTKKTEYGLPPSFKTIYANGTIEIKIPPTTDW